MKTIEFNTRLDKPQAAFVIFYALDGVPWADYEGSDKQKLIIPTCLMINRSDGAVGFVGGMVEDRETLESAAKREVKEEIGYSIKNPLEPLVAHDIGAITTHAFSCSLPYMELRKMQEKGTEALHFGSEITGLFLPHLIDYDARYSRGGGIVNLFQMAMAPSVREELSHFLLKKNIIPSDQLHEVVARAGYSLPKLLK